MSWRLAQAFGAAGVIASAAWAFRPLAPAEIAAPRADALPAPPAEPAPEASFDPRVFSACLWSTPPKPASPAAVEAVAPVVSRPCRLQLLAIISESGGQPALLAALYDPDTDTLHFVAPGECIGRRTVSDITATRVELTDGAQVDRLALDPGGAT